MAKKKSSKARKTCFTVRRTKKGKYTSRGGKTSKLCVCRVKKGVKGARRTGKMRGARGGQFKSC